jgi:hypothetical protein
MLRLSEWFLSLRFAIKTLYEPFFSTTNSPFPARHILLLFIAQLIFAERCKS